MTHYLVDAANVIGSRPDGWWRDRAGAEARLLAALEEVPECGDRFTVVLDRRGTDSRRGAVTVLHARRGGPGAADDRIVAMVAASEEPAALVVVTADRALRARVESLGAAIEGPRTFRARLEL